MGYWINRVSGLEPPFDVVHEQIVSVPAQGHLPVVNSVRKVLFVLGGECRHQIVGVSGPNGNVQLRPGDILSIPCRCEQRYLPHREGVARTLHVVRLAFDAQYLPPPLLPRSAPVTAKPEELSGLAGMVARQMNNVVYLPGGAGTDSALAFTLHELREEARLRHPNYALRVYGLCVSLTVLLARQIQETEGSLRGQAHTAESDAPAAEFHVRKIKNYVREHLAQPLLLSGIAGHVCLSEEHAARLFKKAAGMTIGDYTRHLRITEAKNLLAATELHLGEIAYRCGFASLTVFSRNFKRETGMTPSEFRQQIARQMG